MCNKLHVLILTGTSDNAELLECELRNAGIDFESRIVSSKQEFIKELNGFGPEIILVDHDFQPFDVLAIFTTVKEIANDTPIIIVASSMDEETTINYIKAGAEDYILKEWLINLGPAVNVAVEKRRIRKSNESAEQALRESQRMLSTLMSNLPGMAYRCLNDEHWTMKFVSDGCYELTGYPSEDLIENNKISYAEIIHPDDWQAVKDVVQAAIDAGEQFQLSYRIATADGEEKRLWERGRGIFSESGEVIAIEGFIADVTEHARAGEALQKAHNELEQRVQERTAELAQSNEALRKAYDELEDRVKERTKDLVQVVRSLKTEISERRRVEEELRQRTIELETVFRAFPDQYFWIDPEGTVLAFHAPVSNELIFSQDIIAKPIGNAFPDDVAEVLQNAIEEANESASLVACEYSISISTGLQTFEARTLPLFENRLIVIVRDITKRKRAEEALRSSETLLSSIIDQSPFSTWISDAEGTNIRQNAAFRELFGIECDEQTVGNYNILSDKLVAEYGYRDLVKTVYEEGRSVRFVIPYDLSYIEHIDAHGGAYRILDTTVFPVKDSSGRVVNAVVQHDDITASTRAKEEINRRLDYERMVSEISSRAMTAEDIPTFLSECLRIIGETMDVCWAYFLEYSPKTDTLNNAVEWVAHGCESKAVRLQSLPFREYPLLAEAIDSRTALNIGDVMGMPSVGDKEILEAHGVNSLLGVPLYVGESLYGFLGFAECCSYREWPKDDIAVLDTVVRIIAGVIQHKWAEGALRESECKYRELVENAQEGIWVIDADYNTVFVNSQMAEMLGYTVDEMLGVYLFDFMNEKNAAKARRDKARRMSGVRRSIDAELLRKDGSRIFVKVQTWPVFKEGTYDGSIAFIADNTEQHKLETQLRLSQRLEAIGRMTGGISHEFKNLLMGISGYAEVLQISLGTEHTQYSTVNDLLHCVDRASKLIDKLLAFGKRQSIDPRPTDLNALVSGSKGLVERLLGEHISIEMNLCPEIGIVNVDPGQIEQVLVNLVINARDAMPLGGKLTIKTVRRIVEDTPVHDSNTLEAGEYAELFVMDTGTGMDESVKEQIFEPFFTTKGKKGHTGLGLSVTYGIIKQHHGHIELFSELGKGSAFGVTLPVVDSAPSINEGEVSLKVTGGTETILLAEDEETVRIPAKLVLEDYGYTVLCASNGDEAIELFLQHAGEIDLVIMDLIMPSAGGRAVWETIAQIRPEVKVLFISGYTVATVHKDFTPPKDKPLLAKPFSLFHLASKVRELLD